MSGILIIFHTPSNAGYAMATLEKVFFKLACELVADVKNVHFAFSDFDSGMPVSLPCDFSNYIQLNLHPSTDEDKKRISKYISENNIEYVLAFDAQVRAPLYSLLRRAGVRKIVSYWGAAISGMNCGLKLLAKRVEVAISRDGPDFYIFESEAMREFAINGRGIPKKKTTVISLGVDTGKYKPSEDNSFYAYNEFGICKEKKIVFYSGHMEPRKGVHVIIEAAIELIDGRNLTGWHFLICGNRAGEEQRFLNMLKSTKAMEHVTFAGYRKDLEKIIPSCFVGVIASTGWDSFTMSSLEISSCGLPLLVSSLQGLKETVVDGETGLLFEPGESAQLAAALQKISNDGEQYQRMAANSRVRVLTEYSEKLQIKKLRRCLSEVFEAT